MAGSSLRNSIHRRNHKERAQPLHRAKLGLLEKHKDYVKRARDYKSKRERLKKLKEKIAFRNKDEFYWGMVKGKTENGVHVTSRGNEPLPVDVVRILKTQDANYIRTQIAQDESKINALKSQLHSLSDLIPLTSPSATDDLYDSDLSGDEGAEEVDYEADLQLLREAGVLPPASSESDSKKGKNGKGKGKGKVLTGHVVFAESLDELTSYETPTSIASSSLLATPQTENPEEDDPATATNLGWIQPSSSKKKLKAKRKQAEAAEIEKTKIEDEMEKQEAELEIEARAHRKALLQELSARLFRLSQLRGVEAHMAQQRTLMGMKGQVIKKKSAVKTVVEEEDQYGDVVGKVSWMPKVMKFKAERKR